MKYRRSWDLEARARELVAKFGMSHIKGDRIRCIRSSGSRARRTLARIHAFPKVWQVSLGLQPHYVIEFLSERFDRLSEEEQERVLLHELAHIPKTFSGGLLFHNSFFEERVRGLMDAKRLESSGERSGESLKSSAKKDAEEKG